MPQQFDRVPQAAKRPAWLGLVVRVLPREAPPVIVRPLQFLGDLPFIIAVVEDVILARALPHLPLHPHLEDEGATRSHGVDDAAGTVGHFGPSIRGQLSYSVRITHPLRPVSIHVAPHPPLKLAGEVGLVVALVPRLVRAKHLRIPPRFDSSLVVVLRVELQWPLRIKVIRVLAVDSSEELPVLVGHVVEEAEALSARQATARVDSNRTRDGWLWRGRDARAARRVCSVRSGDNDDGRHVSSCYHGVGD
mmetsp:Transcript_49618/g.105453  ORF Transcript_49618/g.105453 Transcript_49618/m.105453 type:complete len:249 (+) Transcript_49618:34-780(+)